MAENRGEAEVEAEKQGRQSGKYKKANRRSGCEHGGHGAQPPARALLQAAHGG